jgi:hypothetical protein
VRYLGLIFCASLVLSSGCAALIAMPGEDLTVCKSKAEIRAHLGEPTSAGTAFEMEYEEFFSHKLISEANNGTFGPGYSMAIICTLGTWDLVAVPEELWIISRRLRIREKINWSNLSC